MGKIGTFLETRHTSILWVIFVGLFLYLFLRAIYTPILHDEVATFYYYIQTGVFFPPEAHWDANNHVLNSLLSNWFYQVFGSEPWALRMPNVLSFIIYFFASWGIVSSIQSRKIKWLSFLTLVMCHYVFEYFGETRGYGLSMAFLMLGLYLFLKGIVNNQLRFFWLAMISLFLAVSANLTIIYLYLMLLFLMALYVVISTRSLKTKLYFFVSWIFFSFITVAPAVWFSLELKARGALYYGGKSSFIHYTLNTLSDLILGTDHIIITAILMFLFGIVVWNWLRRLFRYKNEILDFSERNLFVLLLTGSITAIFATRYLLGVNFPEDRAAMYLFPLFVLALAFSDFENSKLKTYFIWFKSFAFSVVPILFLTKINTVEASFSMEERAPISFFEYVESQGPQLEFKPTVGGYHTQNLCWYYMNYQNGGKQNSMVYSSFPDTICDFQVLNQAVELPENYLRNYRKVNTTPENGLHLYERKTKLKRSLIVEKDSINSWTHIHDEYFGLLDFEVDSSLKARALLVEIQGVLHAPHSPFQACVVVSQKDADWAEISQERVVLNWLRKDWNDDQAIFKQVLVLPQLNKNAKHVQVFVWNMKNKPMLFKSGKIMLYTLL